METEIRKVHAKRDIGDFLGKAGKVVLFVVISFLLGNVLVLCSLPSIIIYTGSVPVWDPESMCAISFFVGTVVFGSIIVVCRKMTE